MPQSVNKGLTSLCQMEKSTRKATIPGKKHWIGYHNGFSRVLSDVSSDRLARLRLSVDRQGNPATLQADILEGAGVDGTEFWKPGCQGLSSILMFQRRPCVNLSIWDELPQSELGGVIPPTPPLFPLPSLPHPLLRSPDPQVNFAFARPGVRGQSRPRLRRIDATRAPCWLCCCYRRGWAARRLFERGFATTRPSAQPGSLRRPPFR